MTCKHTNTFVPTNFYYYATATRRRLGLHFRRPNAKLGIFICKLRHTTVAFRRVRNRRSRSRRHRHHTRCGVCVTTPPVYSARGERQLLCAHCAEKQLPHCSTCDTPLLSHRCRRASCIVIYCTQRAQRANMLAAAFGPAHPVPLYKPAPRQVHDKLGVGKQASDSHSNAVVRKKNSYIIFREKFKGEQQQHTRCTHTLKKKHFYYHPDP